MAWQKDADGNSTYDYTLGSIHVFALVAPIRGSTRCRGTIDVLDDGAPIRSHQDIYDSETEAYQHLSTMIEGFMRYRVESL